MLIQILIVVVLFLLPFQIKSLINAKKAKKKNTEYQRKIEDHLKTRSAQILQIKKLCEAVSPEAKSLILRSCISELREHLLSKNIKSREILLTYAERAADIGISNGLLADFTPVFQALEQAEEKDRMLDFRNPNEPIAGLFGIPFSVKEQINLKHSRSTCGYASMLVQREPSDNDAHIVKVLRKAGAIPFCSSNVPQALGSIDTVNNIYGQAHNPLNSSRVTGGSSGGEAGMVSSCCTPFGLASDSAGSIRIPSAFCGVYGFKPSPRRISIRGRMGLDVKEEALRENPPTLGPIARSVGDLVLVMRAVFGGFDEDPSVLPLKFQEEEFSAVEKKNLRIGVISTNALMESCDGVKNAIDELCAVLKEKGHTVLEFKENTADQLIDCFLGINGGQTGAIIEKVLDFERPRPYNVKTITFGKIPRFLKRILAFFLGLKGERRLKRIIDVSLKENPQFFHNRKEELKKSFFDYWVKEKFDVLITPVYGIPAPKIGENGTFLFGLFYNLIGNMFEMPCGTVPLRGMRHEETLNYFDQHNDSITKAIRKDLIGSEKLPIGLNVYCKPFEDEKTLGIMKIIEGLTKSLHK